MNLYFNLVSSIAKTSGRAISKDIHFHIVSSLEDDTNFMLMVNQSKMITNGHHDTYDNLKSHFNRLK